MYRNIYVVSFSFSKFKIGFEEKSTRAKKKSYFGIVSSPNRAHDFIHLFFAIFKFGILVAV